MQTIKRIILTTIICFAMVAGVGLVSAWTGAPPSGPPNDNTPTPINVSGTTQTFSASKMFNMKSDGTGIFTIAGGLWTKGIAIFDGNVGIGTVSPGAKLEVNGRIKAAESDNYGNTGYAMVNSDSRIGRWAVGDGYIYTRIDGRDYSIGITLSSEKFKKNIKDLEIDSSKLYNLRPVSFDWNWKDPARGNDRTMGLIAEEVNKYFPEAVLLDENGEAFSLNYDLLVVPMINEMKKLKAEVETLKTEGETTVAGLQAQINELKAASKN